MSFGTEYATRVYSGGLPDDVWAELNPRHPFHHAVRLVAVDRDQVTLRWRDAHGAAHVSFHALTR